MATHATVWSGLLSQASSTLAVGFAVVKNGDDFLPATTANRASYGRAVGIAITATDSSVRSFEYQVAGVLSAEYSGVGTGTAGDSVIVSSTGALTRTALPAGGDDIIGTCPGTSGDVVVTPCASDGGGDPHIAGTGTLEQFGAVGNGIANDTAAFEAAIAALNAGTIGTLVLGAKTYLVNPTTDLTFGFAIVGQGPQSVLKTTANRPIIRIYDADAPDRAKNTLVANLTLLGNSTGTYQYGIESGTFGSDGTGRLTISNVVAQDMGGAGFSWSQGPTTGIGPQLLGCRAINCLIGYSAGDQANLVDCQADTCGTGAYIQAANVSWVGGDIRGSTTKTIHIVASANDGHGMFVGCSFNHQPTAPIYIEAISNGHTFVGCHIYETSLTVLACTGLVQFTNCVLDVKTYTMSGLVKFDSCRFDSDYFTAYNESGTPDVTFLNCRSITGELPSFIYDRLQVHYTFPSDANQTLSAQVSRAETVVVEDGVTSALRTLTLAFPPTKGRKIQFINRNAQVIQVKWSSGTGLDIGANGTGMIVGADGTNAMQLGTPAAP